MIRAIIFSKDRASQLRLLLESIFVCSYKILDGITIIYTSSAPEYAQGYSLLQSETIIPRLKINWVQEMNLRNDTLKAMQESAGGVNPFITFFTDDSLFHRNIQEDKFLIESCMHAGSDIGCFSLRMGLNTTEQMYWRPGNTIKLTYAQVGKLIKWKHTEYPPSHGYGYPMSVDGHVFRAAEITNLVQELGEFTSVNGLEGSLCRYKYEIAPCMASFTESALVTVPVNRVQNVAQNTAGIHFPLSAEELNYRYLKGEVIDYWAISFTNINSTHKELPYVFRSING